MLELFKNNFYRQLNPTMLDFIEAVTPKYDNKKVLELKKINHQWMLRYVNHDPVVVGAD